MTIGQKDLILRSCVLCGGEYVAADRRGLSWRASRRRLIRKEEVVASVLAGVVLGDMGPGFCFSCHRLVAAKHKEVDRCQTRTVGCNFYINIYGKVFLVLSHNSGYSVKRMESKTDCDNAGRERPKFYLKVAQDDSLFADRTDFKLVKVEKDECLHFDLK
jgi:hypothetical protein